MSSKTLALIAQCTPCGTQMHKTFSRLAYEKGVVMVKCGSCGTRHLVADHLGWFREGRTTLDDLYPGQVVKGEMKPSALNEDGSVAVEVDLMGEVATNVSKEDLSKLLVKATQRKD